MPHALTSCSGKSEFSKRSSDASIRICLRRSAETAVSTRFQVTSVGRFGWYTLVYHRSVTYEAGDAGKAVPGSVWTAPGMPSLLTLTVLGFSGHALLFPTVPLWVVMTGGDTAAAGAVNALVMACTVLMQVCMPFALRRLGWNVTWKLGMTLMGVPSLLHLLPLQFWGALALAVPRGFGFGILTVCGAMAVAELVDPRHRGKAIGAYGLAIAAPQAVLLPAAPWIAENVSFAAVFIGGACPLAGLAVTRRVSQHLAAHDTESHPQEAGRAVVMPLLRPMLILLAVTAAGGALLTFTPQMTPNPGVVFASLFAFTVIAALSRWLVGSIADQYGTRPFIAPMIAASCVGLGVVAWAVSDSGSAAALITGMAIVGIAYGGLQNLTLVDSFAAVGRGHRATASAVWNIGFDAGTGVGALLIGMVAAQATFSAALVVTAILSVLTMPLAVARSRRR